MLPGLSWHLVCIPMPSHEAYLLRRPRYQQNPDEGQGGLECLLFTGITVGAPVRCSITIKRSAIFTTLMQPFHIFNATDMHFRRGKCSICFGARRTWQQKVIRPPGRIPDSVYFEVSCTAVWNVRGRLEAPQQVAGRGGIQILRFDEQLREDFAASAS